jgi:hypothetical protein
MIEIMSNELRRLYEVTNEMVDVLQAVLPSIKDQALRDQIETAIYKATEHEPQ